MVTVWRRPLGGLRYRRWPVIFTRSPSRHQESCTSSWSAHPGTKRRSGPLLPSRLPWRS